ncbi:coiled-coil domain-containing protein 34 isoform X1 [Drosophila mojavensis]|uniref:Uncharacterized protein, isoform A n=2 Tax=Drosophila mojavensis TaxID=7230 RepID=B4KGJ3_DROMO|nr:coiled-coil domain-containing protein 34 isoform X1 [Drosophila mojavensis]EDW12189.2 uncharacterized protein Dmoj_GI11252, isoform A [Drosophila mojavensis]
MSHSYTYKNTRTTRITPMAFSGHIDSDGEMVLNDEIYSGRTRISSISTPSERSLGGHSEHSDQSDGQWELARMQCHSGLLYKEQGGSSSSSSAPLSLPPAEGLTYTHSKTNSLYSFQDMYGSLKHIESQSNRVPSLGLTSKDSTLDYMRELEGLKLNREPQVAYETWYASKQRLRQQQLQRQKEERESERQKHELRKRLSKLCYEQWLRNKSQQAEQRRMDEHLQQAALQAASSMASRDKTVRNVPQAEIRKVVQSWWHKKQEQQKRQRLEMQRHQLKKKREEQRRKQLAELAWQKWMTNVYGKPKPVPMNQGMDSLRGSVSAMYVNPTPWRHLKNNQDELKYQK